MNRFDQLLTNAFDEIAEQAIPSPSALADFRARAEQHDPQQEVVVMLDPVNTPSRRPRWLVPAALGLAAAGLLVLGGAIILRSGTDEVTTIDDAVADVPPATTPEQAPDAEADVPPATTPEQAPDATTDDPTTSTPATVAAEPASADGDTAVVMPDWSPVLAGVTASSSSQPASCPAGSQGSLTGLVPVPDFLELSTGPIDATAIFDPSSHSIVVVRRGAETFDGASERETVAGRLDVCSGTWSPMSADLGTFEDGQPVWPNALVYDVDSDVLLAFTHIGVRVYDPATDEWLAQPDAKPLDDFSEPYGAAPFVGSAAYHPASGMIIAQGGFVAAYDVDRAEWHWIGYAHRLDYDGEFLGIDAGLDRLVLAEGSGNQHVTRLVEPATGVVNDIPTPGRPSVRVNDAFGAVEAVGQIDGTVFVSHHGEGTICGFNGQTLAWDLCVDDPIIDVPPITQATWGGEWAIVGDPINNQLVAVPPVGTIRTTPLP